jgi:hypothetical protein
MTPDAMLFHTLHTVLPTPNGRTGLRNALFAGSWHRNLLAATLNPRARLIKGLSMIQDGSFSVLITFPVAVVNAED